MYPIGDHLDPSHCGRVLDCAGSLANYYSHMTKLEYQSQNRFEYFHSFSIKILEGMYVCIFTVGKVTCDL